MDQRGQRLKAAILQTRRFPYSDIVHDILRVMAFLAVTTATNDSSFSKWRCLKTYLRSTMSKIDWMDASLNIHRDFEATVAKVIQKFFLASLRIKLRVYAWWNFDFADTSGASITAFHPDSPVLNPKRADPGLFYLIISIKGRPTFSKASCSSLETLQDISLD